MACWNPNVMYLTGKEARGNRQHQPWQRVSPALHRDRQEARRPCQVFHLQRLQRSRAPQQQGLWCFKWCFFPDFFLRCGRFLVEFNSYKVKCLLWLLPPSISSTVVKMLGFRVPGYLFQCLSLYCSRISLPFQFFICHQCVSKQQNFRSYLNYFFQFRDFKGEDHTSVGDMIYNMYK